MLIHNNDGNDDKSNNLLKSARYQPNKKADLPH
jgi:hypothetical protein